MQDKSSSDVSEKLTVIFTTNPEKMQAFQMKKHWQITPHNPDIAAELMQTGGYSPVIARILAARGIDTVEAAKSFLSPTLAQMLDPDLMAGMTTATSRLLQAYKNQERVCIYGDYDADGICAAAMLVEAFNKMGIRAGYHIPNRMADGYGLGIAALQQIIDNGSRLIVSVDCGITSLQEALFCQQQQVDLIITDHHLPLDEQPEAVAVVNPQRKDCTYPFKGLSGVGVAFNLLVALRRKLKGNGVTTDHLPDLRQWLDLVAIGTIADLVPLSGQNRMLVSAGLKRLGNSKRSGINTLKEVAGIAGEVSAGQVGFRLAPRLNAAGRLESALPGVELLLTQDKDKALTLAQKLDATNTERQQLEYKILNEALALLEAKQQAGLSDGIVLFSPDWHQGVVGIVASRLTELFHKPAILLTECGDGTVTGSGRGISGFHLLDTLHGCAQHLLHYGGHRAAAGLTLHKSKLPDFTAAFEQAVTKQFAENDFTPVLKIDSELAAKELNLQLVQELATMAPFGIGNPEPTLLIRNLQLLEARTIGNGHLKMRLQHNKDIFTAVGWNMAEEELFQYVDVAAALELDTWGGGKRLQLRLKGIKESNGKSCKF